ncbi:MAG TPA: MBL fold metallo-hydrolase [Xanthobacteraceae bacterium]|jgi:L-ascorbate metabolism protein UlaG (beta-lactamase superfamily)|nr:MBL fold metallo-hydrolase [Xanthobacteraceae bacterium]
MVFSRTLGLISAVVATVLLPFDARAQQSASPPSSSLELPNHCPGLVASDTPRIINAAFTPQALADGEARLTYVGHATFLIESPKSVRIATDYNDYVRPSVLPDIATMNHAHSSHYTDRPDPNIKFVLRGWTSDRTPAEHDLTYKDVRVRNVPTNIRDWAGGTERHGNSIFIFELAQLCIAHLGHLHHTLTPQQLNDIGKVDVVLVPVDGSYTLDLEGMMEVLQALKAPLMIPMHFFGTYTLNRFLERARQHWDVELSDTHSIVLSKATLPNTPKVLVLPGR